jgi:molybdopterin-guanine dinucleotide biosynthesis protein A
VSRASVSAVVLAGGRSTRFGRDKLAEPIAGEPLLDRTIVALGTVAGDIVVVVGPEATVQLPAGVRLARDPVAYAGPLVGVVAGLTAVRHASVVVVGGDMPWLQGDVLTLMLEALVPAHEAAALQFDGRRQQLPMALRREAALHAARRLTDSGERRLGALLDALAVATIAEETWRRLDPDGATLRDIDTPDDMPASD